MKATMAQLSKKIQLMTFNTGLLLSEGSSYQENNEQIQFIERSIQDIKDSGDRMPEFNFEINSEQMDVLDTWVDNLRAVYLSCKIITNN